MAARDPASQRLFVDAPLAAGQRVDCTPTQTNYLRNVLRLSEGDAVLVFNGRDGEWRAGLTLGRKGAASLEVEAETRPQAGGPDIEYLFAPLKRSRLDYMVQKATELGVSALRPVMTRHTVAERVNVERMRANAIEAAEQCGILRLPEVHEPVPLATALAGWSADRRLVYCDEAAPVASPLAALAGVVPGPIAVLVGPEGGFSTDEREALLAKPFAVAISLGPRVMRADTAAVAALALVNAALGDWR